VERGTHLLRQTPYGRIAVTSDAIAQIVGHLAAESYGVVGMRPRRGLPRLRRGKLTEGITVKTVGDALEIDLKVVVEHGLNLAEVAATVRSRVAYEVERMTGLSVATVEIRIEDVRR